MLVLYAMGLNAAGQQLTQTSPTTFKPGLSRLIMVETSIFLVYATGDIALMRFANDNDEIFCLSPLEPPVSVTVGSRFYLEHCVLNFGKPHQ